MHPTLASLWMKARQAELLAEARRNHLTTTAAARRARPHRSGGTGLRRATGHALIHLGALVAGETPRATHP